jgi:hypothetical protein
MRGNITKATILAICSIALSGCLSLSLLPRDHDPVLAGSYVDTKLEINNLKCESRGESFVQVSWASALYHSKFMKEYTAFRSDPQAENAEGISVNLQKALDAKNEKMCNHWLKLTGSRMSALETAWRGR